MDHASELTVAETPTITHRCARTFSAGALPSRRDLPQLTVAGVRDDVERAVRPLPDVADPLVAVGEQMLLTDHPVVGERDAHEAAVLESSREEVAAPRGEGGARVELRARRRNDRIPVVDGLLEARTVGDCACDGPAGIFFAVRHHRPAVVLAANDQVQL